LTFPDWSLVAPHFEEHDTNSCHAQRNYQALFKKSAKSRVVKNRQRGGSRGQVRGSEHGLMLGMPTAGIKRERAN
jgi:hypothetical protein